MEIYCSDRWFLLWRLGLADDPEVSVLISEVPIQCAEYFSEVEDYIAQNPGLRIVKGESTDDGPYSSSFWLGPAESIDRMADWIDHLQLRLRNSGKIDSNQSRHWKVSSGRLQVEDWKRLYLRQI
jgi:hypothetical protein